MCVYWSPVVFLLPCLPAGGQKIGVWEEEGSFQKRKEKMWEKMGKVRKVRKGEGKPRERVRNKRRQDMITSSNSK